MADRIELTGLRVRGHHGVLPEETTLGQAFVVDVTCWLDTAEAAAADDIDQSVNYAEVAQLAHDTVAGEPRRLIETVGVEIAEAAMSRWGILHAVEVTIHKPAAPIPLPFDDVAVVVRRSRKNIPAGAKPRRGPATEGA